mmetsp:Transcript_49400/g.127487  ORF Transcript_49400/g.127487 Transcript_49400/m.127487 type:complete len:206 (+) Transcript_49400:1119-1736(+)
MHRGCCRSATKCNVRNRLAKAGQHLHLDNVALHRLHQAPDVLTRPELRGKFAENQVPVVHPTPRHLQEVLELFFERQVISPSGDRLGRRRELHLGALVRRGGRLGRLLAFLELPPLVAWGLGAGIVVPGPHAALVVAFGAPYLSHHGAAVQELLSSPAQHLLLAPVVVLRVLRTELHLESRSIRACPIELLARLVGIIGPLELRH